MAISIQGWFDKWTRKITEELLRNRQAGDVQSQPNTALLKFINPERTKAQLPNGLIVDVTLRGAVVGKYAIGFRIGNRKYVAYKKFIEATHIDDLLKGYTLFRTTATGEVFYVGKIGSSNAYTIPADRLSRVTSPTFSGFSTDGKIIYFIWQTSTDTQTFVTIIENWRLEGTSEAGFTVEGDYTQLIINSRVMPNFNTSNRTKAMECNVTAVDNGQYLVDIFHLWSPPVGGAVTATLSITTAWDIRTAVGPPTVPRDFNYLLWQPGVPYNTFTVGVLAGMRFFRHPSDISVLSADFALYIAESTSFHPTFTSRCFWIKRINTGTVDQRFTAVPNISGTPDLRIPTDLHIIDSSDVVALGLNQQRLGSSFTQPTTCIKAVTSSNANPPNSTYKSFKIDPITGLDPPNPPVPPAESYTVALTDITATNTGQVGSFNFTAGRRKSGASPAIQEQLDNGLVGRNLVDWVIKE